MPRIDFDVKNQNTLALLKRVQSLGSNLKVPLNQAASYAMRQMDKHFLKCQGLDGAWKSVSNAYAKQKKKKGRDPDKILRFNQTLMKSISGGPGHLFRENQLSVFFGTNLKYANIHQFGGIITFKPRQGSLWLKKLKTGKVQFAKKPKKESKKIYRVKYSKGEYQIKMPARPYLYLEVRDQQNIEKIMKNWADKELEKVSPFKGW